jgi:hypothetical protein
MTDAAIGVHVDDGVRDVYTTTIATLPASFGLADDGPVRVIDGRADWTDAVAASADSAAVILVAPRPADAARLAQIERSSVPSVVDFPWSSNPAVDAAASRPMNDPPTVIKIAATVPLATDLESALIDATLLADRLAGDVHYEAAIVTDHAISASGGAGEARLHVSLIRSDAVRARIRAVVYADAEQLIIDLPADGTAVAGQVMSISVDGGEVVPTVYQDAHRSSLLRIERIVRSGDVGDDLAALIRANRAVNRILRKDTV